MAKLLNKQLAFCPYINLDFLLTHTTLFDDGIVVFWHCGIVVFKTFRFTFSPQTIRKYFL